MKSRKPSVAQVPETHVPLKAKTLDIAFGSFGFCRECGADLQVGNKHQPDCESARKGKEGE